MDLLLNRRRAMLSALEVEEYIIFADPVVEQICANQWGDGIGLKPSQAAKVTSAVLGNYFKNNTSITSFDELQYFTGLTTFGNGSHQASPFFGCTNLTSIIIPDTVTTLNRFGVAVKVSWSGGFVGGIANVVIPTSIRVLGAQALAWMPMTGQDINLPNLTSIGQNAFRCCGMSNVVNLGHVTSLGGDYAFNNCTNLKTVVLPSTLTSVQAAAFAGCTALTTITCYATTPPTLGNRALDSTPSTQKIYVPYSEDHSILAAYQAATNWSSYASRINELDANGNIPT